MNRFFVSTPLGFEQVTLQELQNVWPRLLGKDSKPHTLPFPEVQVLEGGLEFEADLFVGVQLNFFLKTAHRVLLRMASFKARDLPKFYQKMKSLPWIEFFPHGHVGVEVAAQTSRLNNEKRLLESAQDALQELFKGSAGLESCGTIYIRMVDDMCTISLDTTGEHLHKRGWSMLKGEAPLRETIAARLLVAMREGGDSSEVTLLDPMMGAGTFLTEARSLTSGQFQRPFAFQKWKKAPKLFLSASFALNYQRPSSVVFKKLVGFDINAEMISVAERNFQEVERQILDVEKKSFHSLPHHFLNQDALATEGLLEDLDGPLWMIVNPPYGERLPDSVSGGLKDLVAIFCKNYKPTKLGVLYPAKERVERPPQGYKVTETLKINNGGIRCLFTILTRL